MQANRIIQNITIQDIDYKENVEQGNQFKSKITLSSPDYEIITGFGAIISLNKNGKEIISAPFQIDDKNNIILTLNTEKLNYGDYSITIRLYTDFFYELGTVYTSSTSISFSFGYIKAPIKIEYIKGNATAQITDLDNEVTSKIENLLQEKISEYKIPIEIAKESSSNSQFLLQIKSSELKASENVQKTKLSATILFQRDGVTLAKSSEASAIGLSKTNMASESAFEQICEQLKNNESFYKSLINSVGETRK